MGSIFVFRCCTAGHQRILTDHWRTLMVEFQWWYIGSFAVAQESFLLPAQPGWSPFRASLRFSQPSCHFVAVWGEGRRRSNVWKFDSGRPIARFVWEFLSFEKRIYRCHGSNICWGPPSHPSDRGPPRRHRYAIQSVSLKKLVLRGIHVLTGFHPSSN